MDKANHGTSIRLILPHSKRQREDGGLRLNLIKKSPSSYKGPHVRRWSEKKWAASQVAVAKAMRDRGDRQHDIAAYFGVNGGRIAEMDEKWPNVGPKRGPLPAAGPYDVPGLLDSICSAQRRASTVRDCIVKLAAELERTNMTGGQYFLDELMNCAMLLDRKLQQPE